MPRFPIRWTCAGRTLHRTVRSAPVAGALVGVLLSGCGSATPGLPTGWGPLRIGGATSKCPPMQGTYRPGPDAIVHPLILAHLEYAERSRPWESITLSGDPARELVAVLQLTSPSVLDAGADRAFVPPDTVRLTRDVAYRCEDGWLLVPAPFLMLPTDTEIEPERRPSRPDLRTLHIAGGSKGSLVARLVSTRMDEITVWCGDGCKGIPLPWTAHDVTTWYRMAAIDDDSDLGTTTEFGGDAREQTMRRKLAEMEHELEYGPPDPVRDRLSAVVQRVLPPGVRLLAVAAHDNGWHVSVNADADEQADALLQLLRGMPDFEDVHEAPLYATRNADGTRHLVIALRLAPTR